MSDSSQERPRVAVVGSGVAGLTTAWLLQDTCDVTLFERNDYTGGHTRTITATDKSGRDVPVDIGFIVMNHRNYPLLTHLFERLGVELGDSDMSFSYHEKETGYGYCGSNIRGLFAGAGSWRDRDHLGMLRAIFRFNRDAVRDLASGRADEVTVGDYLEGGNYGDAFERRYLLPMCAAIWSTPVQHMREFPAASLFRFLQNHGLLAVRGRPQWRYVVGGSQAYVRRMLGNFKGDVHIGKGVRSMVRSRNEVQLELDDQTVFRADHAVVACHADQALAMLSDASQDEQRLLGAWQYQDNSVVLHTDASVMPDQREAWASWNAVSYGQSHDHPVALTYHMNRLQRLDTETPFFVSLNMDEHIAPEHVIHREVLTHPTYTTDSVATQASLPGLNGVWSTHFCGSYFGYGFHEDAVRSAVAVANAFGVQL